MIALKEKSENTAGNVVKLLAGILPLLVACVIFVCTIFTRESFENMFDELGNEPISSLLDNFTNEPLEDKSLADLFGKRDGASLKDKTLSDLIDKNVVGVSAEDISLADLLASQNGNESFRNKTLLELYSEYIGDYTKKHHVLGTLTFEDSTFSPIFYKTLNDISLADYLGESADFLDKLTKTEIQIELTNFIYAMVGIENTEGKLFTNENIFLFFIISNLFFLILWAFTVIFKVKEFSLGMMFLFCVSILKMFISLFSNLNKTTVLLDFRYWLFGKTWILTILYLVMCCCGLAYMIFNFVLKNEELEATVSAGRKMLLPAFFLVLCIVSDILAIFNFNAGGFLMSEGTFIGFLLLGTSLIYARLQDKIAA